MAVNIPLDRDAYRFFRSWLRTTDVLWRDVVDSSIIPAWNEAICREDILDDNNRTPGQRAYITLKKYYPNLDLRWRKQELELLSCRPPKKFTGYFQGDLYCCDIKSAFAQIYGRLSLHADYPNKRLKYPLTGVASELWKDKEGRNAVVGIARSTQNKWCQGEKVWYVKKQNRYLSPVLWAQIMGLLNQCAEIAISSGAVFVNTDGYAFLTESQRDQAVSNFSRFGLITSTLEGEGDIQGISSLSITGVKEPLEKNPSDPVYHLEPQSFDWLAWWSKLQSFERS